VLVWLVLDDELKRDSDVLSLSTSGVYSSSVSTASDSFVSLLNSVDPSQHSLYERSSAEQCSCSSVSVEAVSKLPSHEEQWKHTISPVSGTSDGSRAVGSLLDLDKALLNVDRVETLDKEQQQMVDLTVNSSLHKSSDCVIECLSEINAAQVDSDSVQEVAVKAKKTLHGRSASEGGVFKLDQRFPNLPEHMNVHRRYAQGTGYDVLFNIIYFTAHVRARTTALKQFVPCPLVCKHSIECTVI